MTNLTQKDTEWRPTPKQAKVLLAAMEIGTDRTITKVCEEAGVARKTWYRWMAKDPKFEEAWNNQWETMLDRHMNAIAAAQINKARTGDTAAARLTAELAGKLKNRVEHSGPDGAAITFTVDAKSLDSRLDNLAAAAAAQDDHGEPDGEGEGRPEP